MTRTVHHAKRIRIIEVAVVGLMLLGRAHTAMSQTQAPRDKTQSSVLTATPDIGLDQRVNTQVPENLEFRDETGKTVQLKQYFDGKRPVVLIMPFFKCMTGCTLEMQGLAKVSNQIKYRIGSDFQILSVSINPKETPEIAAAQKAVYTKMYTKPEGDAAKGWHFLVGTQDAIQALSKSVGNRYVYNLSTEQFGHATGIIILTPQGKTYRYLYHTDYDPRDVTLALTEASHNKLGTVVDQLLTLCYHYDPTTGHYGLLIQRIIEVAGTATVLILGSSIFLMLRWEKRHYQPVPVSGTAAKSEAAKSDDRSVDTHTA